MKIGRNEPCPCGSGKKYKKCCLNHDSNFDEITTLLNGEGIGFPNIPKRAEKVMHIISEYKFSDISKAAYCFNSWRDNRSALESCLTLNYCIINCDNFGDKPIESYSDLSNIYQRIEQHLKPHMEDYTLSDFGEVYIDYNNEKWPVILGTGHEGVYAALNFLIELADISNHKQIVLDLLHYIKMVIDKLSAENQQQYIGELRFDLPSEDYWKSVLNLFNNNDFSDSLGRLAPLFTANNSIERAHFAVKDQVIVPLFNTSIIIDYYHHLLAITTYQDKEKHVEYATYKALHNIFDMAGAERDPQVLYPVSIIQDGKFISRKPYTFTALASKKCIIAINKDLFSPSDLKKEIDLILKLHNDNKLHIAEVHPRKGKQCLGVDIPSVKKIQFILYDSFTDITTSHHIASEKQSNLMCCTAIDLFYFICLIDDFDELSDFIQYNLDAQERFFIMGGKVNLFLVWKQQSKMFSKGALEYGMVSVPYGVADDAIYDFFKDNIDIYPFYSNSHFFKNPLQWKFQGARYNFLRLESKSIKGLFGYTMLLQNRICVYLQYNLEFFQGPPDLNEQSFLHSMDELNLRLFNRYKDVVEQIQLLKDKILQIMYLPWDYAEKVNNNGFLDSQNKYVLSDMLIDQDIVIIRYAVRADVFMNEMKDASDKSVECEYFWELVSPLNSYSVDSSLQKTILADSRNKKDIGVFEREVDYYISDKMYYPDIPDSHYIKIRKRIAQVCLSCNITPDSYKGKKATSVIRLMQNALVEDFEKMIQPINRLNLHVILLGYYSFCVNEMMLNRYRFDTLNDLDEDVEKEVRQNIIKAREKNRKDVRALLYLMESNLYLNREGSIKPKNDIVFDLIAYADWLVVLQDNADACYYTDFDTIVQINSEFLVDTINSELTKINYETYIERKYKNKDYHIVGDEIDDQFLKKSILCFKKDTNIDFVVMLNFLEYLKNIVVSCDGCTEIHPNVFKIDISNLQDDFISCLEVSCSRQNIKDIIDFIALDSTKLKEWRGENISLIPLWEREQRDSRLDVKPLLIIDRDVYFSTVVLKDLYDRWKYALPNWFPPYEIGLNCLMDCLREWKKRHEDLMVQKIADIFKANSLLKIWVEADLYSMDQGAGHPPELGDYDIIAVDTDNKYIWIVESKVLQKVGSIYEDQMQQRSFFTQHKDDEKFQRRIDYLRNNTLKVLRSLGIDDQRTYAIRPYMVTNKLFFSRYKKIGFPIVMFSEIKDIIEDEYIIDVSQ